MSVVIDGTTGITTPAETITTNLTFTGTGNRITGDMSNATHVNRVAFQTSVVNGSTSPFFIPNGTGNIASVVVANSSDAANCSYGQLVAVASTEVRIVSGQLGTGTYLPMTFNTSATERMRIDSSGNVGVGTASPASKLAVGGNPPTAGVLAAVSSSGGVSLALSDNVNNSLYVKHVASGVATFGTDSGGQIAFATNGFTERMRIDSSGNVGVGTAYPAAPLDVSRTAISANTPAMLINSYTTTSVPSGTATTVYALPASGIIRYFQVFISTGAGTADTANYAAYAIIAVDSTARLMTVVQGGLMTIALSGLNIRITQGSGVTMGALRCSVIQILAKPIISMTINKNYIDQPAHFIVALVLVVLFSFITALWMAAIISAMTGLMREIYQRYDEDRAWYDFGPGSRLDLIFWALGTAAGVAIMFFWYCIGC